MSELEQTSSVAAPATVAIATAPAAESTLARDAWRSMRRNPVFWAASLVVVIVCLMAIAPQLFAGWFGHGDPRVCELRNGLDGPTDGHPFGFDRQGCDLYANVIYGARTSISVGLLVASMCLVVALILGSAAGYFGRAVDAIISRLADVFFGFPFILGGIVILTVIEDRNVFTVAAVLALFAWPSATRLMRSTVLQVRDSNYVVAARALGAGDFRILGRHVLPNAATPLVVFTSVSIGGFIAAEAALTFLGVGLQYPSISWGLQLSNSQSNFRDNLHLLVFPGGFLSVTVVSFVLLGDIIRDTFDPKAR